MAILNTVLLVLFVIVAVLLILLVLVQNEEGGGLGGVFAGGGSSAFGSRSGNILSRVSSVLGGLFLVLAFVMALLTRSPQRSGVEAAGRALTTQEESGSAWWDEDAALNDTTGTTNTLDTIDAIGANGAAGDNVVDTDSAAETFDAELPSDNVPVTPDLDVPQTDAADTTDMESSEQE
ncbi:MAG: preprotein translocase subunit SecG [Spirochaetaceae bacterium]|jgi:preprotein translocase subunit SecG|nr:preprotein translocase subunit SecG [Spirochaetaceae bacterium]